MSVSMTVTWPVSKHANPVVYQLQYRPRGSQVWINASAVPSVATTAMVTGLIPGTVYEFRHIATNAPVWTEISVATELRAGVPPTTPTHLTVS